MTTPHPILWFWFRVVALVYAAFMLIVWVASTWMIFRPHPSSYGAALPGLQEVPAADGTPLAVLYLPNPAARHTLFYFHGNAEDIGDNATLLEAVRQAGFSVLAFDYRGYGRSGGKATERNVYADTQAVLAHAQAKWGVKPEQMIVLGRSVGSGPAVELAARAPVAGLVLVSPLASAYRVVTKVRLLPFDVFNNLGKAAQVRCPSLVIHGTADEIIPIRHGESVFAELPEPKRSRWIPGGRHNDLYLAAGREILKDVVDFAEGLPGAGKR